jgi:N-acetyltransferase 10
MIWPKEHGSMHGRSHKKKRMKQIKKAMQRGLMSQENDDPFAMFVASTNIRYCYYADTTKVTKLAG